MARGVTKRAQRHAVLAAIARREWLLQMLALGAAGCGRDRALGRSSQLIILYPGDEWVLGPAADMQAKLMVFLQLVGRDANGALVPRLAERWERSPDGRTWTVHLRHGIRWHDGVPVTAHDVKFTLDLLTQVEAVSPAVAPGSYAVTVLDDYTYTITLYRRAPGVPTDDYTVFYPRHLLANLDPQDFPRWDFWTRPVGNGPYRYHRHVEKTMMELEANPDFFLGRPNIERVVLKFGRPSLTELVSGNVDALAYIDQTALLSIAGDPRFEAHHMVNGFDHHVILWNHRRPMFDDPLARRALTLAIDRYELQRVVNLPPNLPVVDTIFTQDQFQRGALPAPLPFDPAEAGRLLTEAGWRDEDGNGVRERRGEPFRFVALVPPSGAVFAPSLEKAALYVQARLRQVGVDMAIRTLDIAAGRRLENAGQFDASFRRLTVPAYRRLFSDNTSPIGYVNPDVRGPLERAGRTVSPEEEDRIYLEARPAFERDHPLTYLYPDAWTTVAHRRVRGWSESYLAEAFYHMEDLWLDDRRESQ